MSSPEELEQNAASEPTQEEDIRALQILLDKEVKNPDDVRDINIISERMRERRRKLKNNDAPQKKTHKVKKPDFFHSDSSARKLP